MPKAELSPDTDPFRPLIGTAAHLEYLAGLDISDVTCREQLVSFLKTHSVVESLVFTAMFYSSPRKIISGGRDWDLDPVSIVGNKPDLPKPDPPKIDMRVHQPNGGQFDQAELRIDGQAATSQLAQHRRYGLVIPVAKNDLLDQGGLELDGSFNRRFHAYFENGQQPASLYNSGGFDRHSAIHPAVFLTALDLALRDLALYARWRGERPLPFTPD